MTDLIAKLDAPGRPMPNPTEADLVDPIFEAIWQTIKSWDVNTPEYYVGYCGANGSHVKLFLDALASLRAELLAAREVCQAADWVKDLRDDRAYDASESAYRVGEANLARLSWALAAWRTARASGRGEGES